MKSIVANAAFGLAVCTALLTLMELSVRLLPSGIFTRPPFRIEPLAPADRGNEALRKNGYRGKRPCRDCPADTIRIVSMGGSSTYGVPMRHAALAYPARLEQLLIERHPGQRFEVLNGGIPGYGIFQIVDSLEKEVLKIKPDIVTICAWFNDSSKRPSWYGYLDRSDRESMRRVDELRRIEGSWYYRFLSQLRLYALLRGAIVKLTAQVNPSRKRRSTGRRTTPEEFRLGLERVLELSRQYDFKVILIFEPLNRTLGRQEAVARNRYYRVIEEIARAHSVPVVDTLTAFHEHHGEWLFYDFIHPNEHGHRIIAEAIYRTVFADRREFSTKYSD